MKDVKGTIEKLIHGKNKYLLILAAAAVGVVLLLIPTGGSEPEQSSTGFDAAKYELELEQKLTDLIEKIDGAGTPSVVVTLESGSQSVYANSEKESSVISQENGNSNTERSSESEIIIVDSGGKDQPLVVTELLPRIKGVVVVCPGARDAVVREKIVLAVMTALNITVSNVYVTY